MLEIGAEGLREEFLEWDVQMRETADLGQTQESARHHEEQQAQRENPNVQFEEDWGSFFDFDAYYRDSNSTEPQ